jgi:biopolymer transport protein ExbD
MKRLRDLDHLKDEGLAEVNMSPLVDMVFLLLIFFMVTSVFVHQESVKVDSPEASQSQPMKSESVRFTLTADGKIYYQDQEIRMTQIKPIVVRATVNSKVSVIVLADQASTTKNLIALMDCCREAGAVEVSVATNKLVLAE